MGMRLEKRPKLAGGKLWVEMSWDPEQARGVAFQTIGGGECDIVVGRVRGER